jgi:glyoxylase-like metal-dependent hydrolase (beta-lactamase superfamily II)
MMKVQQLKLGPMDNLSYVAWDTDLREAVVIDPAWQPEVIEEFLNKQKLTLKLLLLTHAHPDHDNAARYFLEKDKELALNVHKEDVFLLDDDIKPLNLLKGEEELMFGRIRMKVLHTPGHTPGSVSYLAEGAVFTGDTLFVGQCGRADLPGSDPKALRLSLLKLAALPGETVLYPGHSYNGNTSTIGVQKEYNIYMKLAARGEAEFVKAAV